MPQPLSRQNRQKGSTLITVVALSTVMTMAAGGFMLVVSNAGKDLDTGDSGAALHYVAESAIILGARWIRCHDSTSTVFDPTTTTSLVITPGVWKSLYGASIRVSFDPGSPLYPAGPLRTLNCAATFGTGKDTVFISWDMNNLPLHDADPVTHCKPVLSNWRETVHPGK